ncbi:hypothetical protein LAZ40_00320, partial [Cereibacter sphaeroides]|uniref:hypothetical protein n=1 Tax=Cereibacter sphaeroides TaxID=1063 RepID=UPI001F1AA1F8
HLFIFARIFSGLDYIWYAVAIIGLLLTTNSLEFEDYQNLASRMDKEEQSIRDRLHNDFSEAKKACQDYTPIYYNDEEMVAADRVLMVQAQYICDALLASQNSHLLTFDYHFIALCRDAGLEDSGSSVGEAFMARPDLAPIDAVRLIDEIGVYCIYAIDEYQGRRASQTVREQLASFEVLLLDRSSKWFLFILLAASIRLTKTTRETFLPR